KQPHGEGVDDHLIDSDVRELLCGPVALLHEHTAAELEHGVLVNDRQLPAPGSGKFECGLGHAIAASTGDEADRNGRIVRWTKFSRTGNHIAIRLEALIVFPNDDEIDIVEQ